MVRIPFKRGDTFLLEGVLSSSGTPQDMTGWTVRAQARAGTLVIEFDVEYTNRAIGVYRLRKAHDAAVNPTTGWPVKVIQCDIEYVSAAGQVMSTETFEIDVLADVTR